MKHEMTIKWIERELESRRNVLASSQETNRIHSTAAMLIADKVHPSTLSDETKEERAIKHRVQDAFAVFEATKPFGQEAVDRKRTEIVDRLLSGVAWYEQKLPEDNRGIAELEETLAMLVADQPKAQAA